MKRSEKVLRWKISFILPDNNIDQVIINDETNFINLTKRFFLYLFQVSKQ